MNHSQKVLTAAMPAVHELDQLIKQLEQNLGKAHTVSPFTNLYAQQNVKITAPEKKAEPEKKAAPAKKEE